MQRCLDCLTEDVTVKVIDLCGFEHWFCAECWQAAEEFSKALHDFLAKAVSHLLPPTGEDPDEQDSRVPADAGER